MLMTAPFVDIEVKAADGDIGIVEGYASVFGSRDSGPRADRVMPGAFAKSLALSGKQVVYLPSHDYAIHVKDIPAVPIDIREDSKGLYTATKFFLTTQAGRDSFTVLKEYQKAGRPIGMSFTFKPVEFELKAEGRDLTAVDLYEYGHTALPMHPGARTTSAKAYYSSAELRELAGRGEAMPDGSFPIVTHEDLHRAVYDYALYGGSEGAKDHIMARAQALGMEGDLPAGWKRSMKHLIEELAGLREEPEFKSMVAALITGPTGGPEIEYYERLRRALDFIHV